MTEEKTAAIQEQPVPVEPEKKPFDVLLVFGQGPVIGKESRLPAGDSGEENEDVNFWSKEMSKAAKILYDEKQVGKVIVMGGKTGGASNSEGALIAKPLQKAGVPVETEEGSTNSLENLVNLINEHPEIMEPESKNAIMGSDFHLSRIRQLMEMFEIPYTGVFSAEAVSKYAALQIADENILHDLARRLDITADSKKPNIYAPGYYLGKKGTEQRGVEDRTRDEAFLSRALLDQPKYWVGYIGGIRNDELMMRLLQKQDPRMLKNIFAVDLSEPPDQIRGKLLPFTKAGDKRVVPSPKLWKEKPWPKKSVKALEDIVDKRNAAMHPDRTQQ